MVNRPMTLEVDSNEFDSFLGKKAKARRQAKKDAKNGVPAQLSSVDPLIAGELPTADFGKKAKPPVSANPNAGGTKAGDATTDTTNTNVDASEESFFSKHKTQILIGAVAVFAGYWFFYRKKK
jgi:hypothetical protein